MDDGISFEERASTDLGVWRGGVVAPPAALTGTPTVQARRHQDAPPLETLDDLAVGILEAPSVGVPKGAKPPFLGDGEAGAPNLDTYGTSHQRVPQGPALFAPRWMRLDEYRAAAAEELKRLALWYAVHGKRRRNFMRKARALRSCGQFARVRRCGSCGTADPASACIQCDCDLRCCPSCARRRANILRTRLDEKWRSGERPRTMALHFITFTLRYDPMDPNDLSVEGLKRRKQIIRDAVGYVWRTYLKKIGRAMALAVEVSPRGSVHIHSLFHGHRPDVNHLRAVYMFRAGDSPYVNCQYVRRPAKAIRELAKYMMKAASPKNLHLLCGGRGEFIDPILAARAEVAFSGDRLFECLGAWRGADDDEDPPEIAPTSCTHCGSREWRSCTVRFAALMTELPADWTPRFGRAGPGQKAKPPRPKSEQREDAHV